MRRMLYLKRERVIDVPMRKLALEDRVLYLEMAKEFYASEAVLHPVPEMYFERTFAEMMRSDVYVEGYLLLDGKEAAGYAVVSKTFSQEAGGMAAWLEEVYIRPKHQGKGIGTAFFVEWEKSHPEIVRQRLEVERDNDRAIRLYESLGFSEILYYQMTKDK